MKVSDIMLDLETGDASVHDAYIQESYGQVKVSAAIYDAAKKIASLDDSEKTDVFQEAATEAGLPTDRDGAIALMYEATERELVGTCRHLYQEAAKIDEAYSKPTSPLAGLNKLGKVCGVKSSLNGSKAYAAEFAQAVMKNKDLNLKGGAKFLKAGAAKSASKALINGVVQIANAFGIDCETLFSDETVYAVVPAPKNSKCSKGDCDISYMVGCIKNAGSDVKGAGISESDYTTSVTKNDVATVVTCNFAVAKTAKFIKSKFGENGAKLEARASAAMKKLNKKKVSGDIEDANEKGNGAKEINGDIQKLVSELITGFNNSFYSLLQAKGEEN
jgi:hypothetical protein